MATQQKVLIKGKRYTTKLCNLRSDNESSFMSSVLIGGQIYCLWGRLNNFEVIVEDIVPWS